MAILISTLIASVRSAFNDTLADHFAKDDLTKQVDGTNLRFKLNCQNVVDHTTDGAPSDPAVYVAGTLKTVTTDYTVSKATGLIVFVTGHQPTAGQRVSVEYFYVLIPDADYISFAQGASDFVGVKPTFTATTDYTAWNDLLNSAAEHYMHSHAAQKMANLSSWYYSANAGNKSFDKKNIAAAFSKTARDEAAEAVERRDDVYKRQGQRNAPAMNQSAYSGARPYQPPR
jgi:hypothetical protein